MNKIIAAIFKNKSVILSKLPEYGFSESGGIFSYATEIIGGLMTISVKIDASGNVDAKVFDTDFRDEYALFLIDDATGGFVGTIREEYEKVLRDIAEKCCETEIFKSSYAKRLIRYVKEKYGDEPEFLWEKFDDNAVWRRKDNKKWYGLICKVPKRKLGVLSDETVEIAVIIIRPEEMERTIDGERYFRGYHMNKKHWLTISLDGDIPFKDVCDRLDDSYVLAGK